MTWIIDRAGLPGRNTEIRNLEEIKDKLQKSKNLVLWVGEIYKDKKINQEFLEYIESQKLSI